MIATAETAPTHAFGRLVVLVTGSTLAMLVVHALISTYKGSVSGEMLFFGQVLCSYLVPLGIFALHVLVHRGPLWQGLLLAVPTTFVSYQAACFLGELLGMSIERGFLPTRIYVEVLPR